MKATSAILVQSQHQPCLLGLPIPLLMATAGAAAAAAGMMIVLDWIALLLPVSSGVFGGLWLLLLREARGNPFLDRDLFLASRFWAGKGKARVLIAGGRVT